MVSVLSLQQETRQQWELYVSLSHALSSPLRLLCLLLQRSQWPSDPDLYYRLLALLVSVKYHFLSQQPR